MRVILREDVPKLGKAGDIVKVSDGYGRNYLLPRKLAVVATEAKLQQIEHERRVVLRRREKLAREIAALREKLEGLAVTVPKRVGENDRLFGSVTPADITAALADEGYEIDRKQVRLDEPIRSLGVFPVRVVLGAGVEATIKVWVVAK